MKGSLSSGTKATGEDEGLFGYKAVCAILRAGRDSGVKMLSLRGLVVEFFAEGASQLSPSLDHPDTLDTGDLPEEDWRRSRTIDGARVSARDTPLPLESLMTTDQKAHLQELELSHMMMTDPIGYENRVIDDLMVEETRLGEEA